MKKMIAFLALFFLLIISCNKNQETGKNVSQQIIPETPLQVNSPPPDCGGNLSGNYTAPGTYPTLYTYPLELLNISCAADGATITVIADPLDVPNRFTIVDQNNNIVALSGSGGSSYWIGSNCIGPGGACFYGPWGGGSLPSGSSSFTFTKAANTTYYVKIEAYIPDSYYQHRQDGWNVNITCTCASGGGGGGGGGGDTCSCGKNYYKTYTATGTYPVYYSYPLDTLNLSCAHDGATITVMADPLDVPNKFVIVDQNNNFVAASGSGGTSYWIGSNCIGPGGACFGGPWGGGSLPSGSSNFTFIKAPNTTYILRVDSYIPDIYYQHRQDGWNAYIYCTN